MCIYNNIKIELLCILHIDKERIKAYNQSTTNAKMRTRKEVANMNEKINVQVDKELANAISIVNQLRASGVLDVNTETVGVLDMWNKLSDANKVVFFAQLYNATNQ